MEDVIKSANPEKEEAAVNLLKALGYVIRAPKRRCNVIALFRDSDGIHLRQTSIRKKDSKVWGPETEYANVILSELTWKRLYKDEEPTTDES